MKTPLNSLSKSLTLLHFILPLLFSLKPAPSIAQSLYSGPASGSIIGGVYVSTNDFPDAPESPDWNLNSSRPAINPEYTIISSPRSGSFNLNPLAPPGSNEIYDPSALPFLMQNVHSPGVIIDFEGSQMPGPYYPPDPHIAAGPNHIIVVDNSRFIIYDKIGTRLKAIRANDWYSGLFQNSGPFDCQIIYDHYQGRWVQEWLMRNAADSTSFWLVSVSDDDDPLGTWINYAFPAHLNGTVNTSLWGDYPKIAYDQQAFYISARQVSFAQIFRYCKLRIIPKSQLYNPAAGAVDYTDIWDFRVPADPGITLEGPPIPACNFDSSTTAYLIVDSPSEISDFVVLWTIENPISHNPVISATAIPVTASLAPPDAQQLGGSTLIFTDRRRFRNAVVREGNLWTANSVAGGSSGQYCFARYLRLDVISKTVLEDVAFGADGYFYFYPAVMVDQDKNLTLVFSRSSAWEYVSAAYSGRRDNDPPGLAPSRILKEGKAYFVGLDPAQRNRWGDYMGIALDPAEQNRIWGFIQYAENPANTWGIRIGAFTFRYTLSGRTEDALSQEPVPFASITIPETGHMFESDSLGQYSFGAPSPDVTLNVSAFAHRDTSTSYILSSYGNDTLNIPLQPQIESTIAGRIIDDKGNGIEAELRFYAHGNPSPLPYTTTVSDSNGYYQLQTIIGDYDIEIYPEAPFLFKRQENITLTTTPLTLNITLQMAQVLLVDDDRGKTYETYYLQALNSFSLSYYLWDVQALGIPSQTIRNSFPDTLMIWFTGDSSHSPLNLSEQQAILQHLAEGGKLFLAGQDIAQYSFNNGLGDTLGIAFQSNTSLATVRPIAGNAISDNLFLLIWGTGGANNQTSQDILSITDNITSASIFYYGSNPDNIAGIQFENSDTESRMVFLGFGFEAITDSSNRNLLMQRVMEYLAGRPLAIPEVEQNASTPDKFVLLQNYPNPFNPSTTIEFTIPQSHFVSLKVYNLLGEEITTLLSASLLSGNYKYEWNASDLASGVYFYKLEAGKFTVCRKMLLLR